MFLATAIFLMKFGILTEADVEGMLEWLRTETSPQVADGQRVYRTHGNASEPIRY